MNENLNGVLADLISKLNNVAPHLWESMVKKAIVEGWINVLIFVVLISVVGFLVSKMKCEDRDISPLYLIYALCNILLGLMLVGLLCGNLANTVNYIVNPDAMVIKDLMSLGNNK